MWLVVVKVSKAVLLMASLLRDLDTAVAVCDTAVLSCVCNIQRLLVRYSWGELCHGDASSVFNGV